jgi:hypothetical protein
MRREKPNFLENIGILVIVYSIMLVWGWVLSL